MEFWKYNFESLSTEHIDSLATKVTGKIPSWIQGTFLKVGPGKFDLGNDFCSNHFFDGLSSIFSFRIKGNQIYFSRRFLQSDAYKKAVKNGKPVYGEFGTRSYSDSSKGMLSRMFATFDPTLITDNGTFNVVKLGRELFACSETFYIRRIDGKTLETKEKVDLSKYMPTNCLTCHPLVDHEGNMFNVGTSFLPTPKFVVLKVSPSSHHEGKDVWLNSEVICSVPSQWKSGYGYVHSLSITENYLIFLETPLIIHLFRLATGNVKGRCLMDCWDYYDKEPVKFIVVNRRTGELVKTKYFSDKCFLALHHINAYELGNQIIVDLTVFPDLGVFNAYYLKHCRNNIRLIQDCRATRFVIPLIHNIHDVPLNKNLVDVPNCSASAFLASENHKGDYIKLVGAKIGEYSFDMHCFNHKLRGKPYKYIYGVGGLLAPENSINTITKLDADTGEAIIWRAEESQHPSEPVFVPNPNSTEEDEGLLLVTVKETRPGEPHFLLILDARTLSEIARAETYEAFSYGLHGIYLPDDREKIPYEDFEYR